MFAFARTVDDTAHDRDRHVLDPRIVPPPLGHSMAEVRLDALRQLLKERAGRASAARARYHHGCERTQSHRLQDLLRHHDFLRAVASWLGRERRADGVADPFLQQHGHPGGGGDDPLRAHAGLRQAQV